MTAQNRGLIITGRTELLPKSGFLGSKIPLPVTTQVSKSVAHERVPNLEGGTNF